MSIVEKCASGPIPKNVKPHEDAGLVFYRDGIGLVKLFFGSGDNLAQEDYSEVDENGNGIDSYIMICLYEDHPLDGCWKEMVEGAAEFKILSGLMFAETDGGQLLYSKKSHPSGDIREFIRDSFEFVGIPTDVENYHLVSSEGSFYPNKAVITRRMRED